MPNDAIEKTSLAPRPRDEDDPVVEGCSLLTEGEAERFRDELCYQLASDVWRTLCGWLDGEMLALRRLSGENADNWEYLYDAGVTRTLRRARSEWTEEWRFMVMLNDSCEPTYRESAPLPKDVGYDDEADMWSAPFGAKFASLKDDAKRDFERDERRAQSIQIDGGQEEELLSYYDISAKMTDLYGDKSGAARAVAYDTGELFGNPSRTQIVV